MTLTERRNTLRKWLRENHPEVFSEQNIAKKTLPSVLIGITGT